MRLQVKARNFELSPEIRDVCGGEAARLSKQLAERNQVEVELVEETKHVAAHRRRQRSSRRARRCGRPSRRRDMRASIDQLVANLERQVVTLPREAPPRTPPAAPSTTAFEPVPAKRAAARPARARGRPRRSTATPSRTPPPSVGRSGIHGNHRAREWDAVDDGRRAGARRRPGGVRRAARRRASSSIEGGTTSSRSRPRSTASFRPVPRRGRSARRARSGRSAARRIEIVELPDVAGEEIELSSHDGERTLLVDGEQRLRLDPGARAARPRRPRPADRRRRLGGRGSTRSERCRHRPVGPGPADTL